MLGNEPSPLGTVESYNPVKRRWEYVAPMPTARCSSALLQTPSMMYVIGGVSQGPSNAVEALCLPETV
ncbi:Kelch domain containing protein 8B [Dissostichus eleginoides]|uniref:Kelch domain-containing protein 8B n=1 Tax=Dissostichus eleginoides TaxID=100907 RepID=A0AAD9CCC5_DISEL|nr:Kelch domain containing protein 8B [Dissostichus eleginoides]